MPIIVVLNMMDEALSRGLELDLAVLQQELDCPIIPTVAERHRYDQLKEQIKNVIREGRTPEPPEHFLHEIRKLDFIRDTYAKVDQLIRQVTINEMNPDTFTEKLDRWVLHPVWGLLILVVFLVFVFQLMFSWAGPLMDLVETGVTSIKIFQLDLSPGLFQSFVVDGVIAGVIF